MDRCAGNQFVAELIGAATPCTQWILRIDMTDFTGVYMWAEYSDFILGGAATLYNLESLGNYSGNASKSKRSLRRLCPMLSDGCFIFSCRASYRPHVGSDRLEKDRGDQYHTFNSGAGQIYVEEGRDRLAQLRDLVVAADYHSRAFADRFCIYF